ncbi:DEAD/DEAH box helicase family protein, partial [Vibrio parahaemolyticus V-223/04]
KPYC